jgi:hypothetical protein
MPITKGALRAIHVLLLVLAGCAFAHAQGGPPLLTDDPGTAEYKHWEINLAVLPEIRHDSRNFELPLVDFNYGANEHTQLKFEIPLLVQWSDTRTHAEAGNGNFGVKWRFVDQEKHGFDLSTYPQFGFNTPGPKLLVDRGASLLLPLQIAKTFGKFELNADGGYIIHQHGMDELSFGLAAGYQATKSLELMAELHSVPLRNFSANESVFQLGGRKRFSEHYIFLFAAGRGIPGSSDREPKFLGYFGLQIIIGK